MLLRILATVLPLAVLWCGWSANPAPAVAKQSPEIAQATEDAGPVVEAPLSPEEAAEEEMLEKADVAAAIAYVEAHLRAAQELIGANPTEAETHLARARDFLGPEMSDSLTEAGVPSLAAPVAATATGGPEAIDAAITALAAARGGVGTGVPDPTRYALKVAANLLYFALDEYRAWINDPGPATIIDYQGSRSLAQLAAALFEPVKPAVASRSQDVANGIANAMAAIRRAFPGTAPPAKPTLLEGDMKAQINAVNELSEGF
jgi:hypothetical protein